MGKERIDVEIVPDNQEKAIAYETLTVKQTEEALGTDIEEGLTSDEAKLRLEKYGPNKLEEKKKKSWISIFFSQMDFTSLLKYCFR